ncbi:chromodomain helicase [Pseudozyma hubeiensis SY62]|uniref:Chromodomain helicase n=1 Tax=Pseudozyma hubeiensis (strain SY62) TaxID=1305764 RepID=R9NXV0_PSEHS|nr:chromodomain helicase [Pseudozyma hubeiensis SY62]GAC93436.1 chromodomain helicase [Pseudozyma hubeiensis SY62]
MKSGNAHSAWPVEERKQIGSTVRDCVMQFYTTIDHFHHQRDSRPAARDIDRSVSKNDQHVAHRKGRDDQEYQRDCQHRLPRTASVLRHEDVSLKRHGRYEFPLQQSYDARCYARDCSSLQFKPFGSHPKERSNYHHTRSSSDHFRSHRLILGPKLSFFFRVGHNVRSTVAFLR